VKILILIIGCIVITSCSTNNCEEEIYVVSKPLTFENYIENGETLMVYFSIPGCMGGIYNRFEVYKNNNEIEFTVYFEHYDPFETIDTLTSNLRSNQGKIDLEEYLKSNFLSYPINQKNDSLFHFQASFNNYFFLSTKTNREVKHSTRYNHNFFVMMRGYFPEQFPEIIIIDDSIQDPTHKNV
jgi:hypothetical protein